MVKQTLNFILFFLSIFTILLSGRVPLFRDSWFRIRVTIKVDLIGFVTLFPKDFISMTANKWFRGSRDRLMSGLLGFLWKIVIQFWKAVLNCCWILDQQNRVTRKLKQWCNCYSCPDFSTVLKEQMRCLGLPSVNYKGGNLDCCNKHQHAKKTAMRNKNPSR